MRQVPSVCRVLTQWRATKLAGPSLGLCRYHFHLHPSPQAHIPLYHNIAYRCLRSSSFLMKETEGEAKITDLLVQTLSPSYVKVKDISGGCGSMYEIVIDSELFKGKRLIQQHRMINEALGDEVKSLHGLTIRIDNPEAKED